MKLIDGHAMIARVEELQKCGKVDLAYYNIVREAVQMEPEVDAVPVVRCRNCVHWNKERKFCANVDVEYELFVLNAKADAYCSIGAKKEADE